MNLKMAVAYVDPEHFEGIRKALLELGFPSLSFLSAGGTVPEATLTATYRGTAVERHSRAKARLECVDGADCASTVVDTVLTDDRERSFVFVVPVERAYPAKTVKTDDVAVPAG